MMFFFAACSPAPELGAPPSFVEEELEGGTRWTWTDADVEVELLDASSPDRTLGLYVSRGGVVAETVADHAWLEEEGGTPLFLIWARSDGEEPTMETSPRLELALAGSTEHGCPADELTWTLQPLDPDGKLLSVRMEGVPYLAVPTAGSLVLTTEGQDVAIEQEDLAEPVYWTEWDRLRHVGAEWSMTLIPRGQTPLLQLQDQETLIEVDFDHSCELEEPVLRPTLDLLLEFP